MRIGALSRETGVSPRLLRYYEEQGLLSSHRGEGGHRRYDAGAPVVVRRIRTLLAAGLPTKVIRDVLPCVSGSGEVLDACTLGHLRDRLTGLEAQLAEIQATRDSLAALVAATENSAPVSVTPVNATPEQAAARAA
ncbi:MerR family transcriptional regulator [Nonomuraea rubra]|uniref:DNA-binding transcriptional MerR regulator n=1 Tax=Nonomuraea rubra TaxID=46180 RepID=A0A7X0U2N9_9ACTN|nr:MerR family transcriptional regulator [Nonomuraea rubra]MBB6552976.1 DNA-binding transcriptional MerR regulator [Nonomuraea rubra]